ncbi:MAG TPA: hypothetical protein VD735_04195 [Candidatus Saccharimonadales bacterium]|nr:hypothetical protein [Candidatus Saccharimonadales bacterium]
MESLPSPFEQPPPIPPLPAIVSPPYRLPRPGEAVYPGDLPGPQPQAYTPLPPPPSSANRPVAAQAATSQPEGTNGSDEHTPAAAEPKAEPEDSVPSATSEVLPPRESIGTMHEVPATVVEHLGPIVDVASMSENTDQSPEPVEAERDTRNCGHPLAEEPKLAAPTETKPIPEQKLVVEQTDTHSVITDLSYPDQRLSAEVAAVIAQGIPETWQAIDTEGGSDAFYLDDADDPTLFLKAWTTGDQQLAAEEMDVAPYVEAIVSDKAVQQLARDNGFSGITYIRPIAAGSDRQAGKEYTVYPWVDAYLPDPWDRRTRQFNLDEGYILRRIHSITKNLRSYFAAQTINPFDLHPRNVLVSRNTTGPRHLYLVDATEFSITRT